MNAVEPNASQQLDRLEVLPDDRSRRVLSIILSFACKAQNDAAHRAGREAFAKIPLGWRACQLHQVVTDTLDLTDEWEYRRLLELLEQTAPDQLPPYIRIGLNSANEEIVDAANDFLER
jgi:hypothetical protein